MLDKTDSFEFTCDDTFPESAPETMGSTCTAPNCSWNSFV